MTSPRPYTFSQVMDRVAKVSGACVNYEDLSGVTDEVPELKLRADQHYHHGPYCEFAKKNGNFPICGANKSRSKEAARKKKSPFEGFCPLGVWDLAHPIIWENEVIGIFYLGGFRGKQKLAEAGGQAYAGTPLAAITSSKKQELRRLAGHLAEEMVLILKAGAFTGKIPGKKKHADFYVRAIREFIEAGYQENVTLEQLAANLKVHPTYLGKILQEHFKKSFRDLLTAHRIERAKTLLVARKDLSITEIAAQTGFSDSNYFSTVFRKITGKPPSGF